MKYEGKNVEEDNILKLKKEMLCNDNLYEIDYELLNKKVEEYKKKVDNNDFKFKDTILNLGLIAHELMKEKEEKYKVAGKIIYDTLYS